MNNGTFSFDRATDGESQMMGGRECRFRSPSVQNSKPVHMRVIYKHNTLQILSSAPISGTPAEADRHGLREFLGVSAPGVVRSSPPRLLPDEQMRLSRTISDGNNKIELKTVLLIPGVYLPDSFYFGFSASTGTLTDTHILQNITIGPVEHGIPITSAVRNWVSAQKSKIIYSPSLANITQNSNSNSSSSSSSSTSSSNPNTETASQNTTENTQNTTNTPVSSTSPTNSTSSSFSSSSSSLSPNDTLTLALLSVLERRVLELRAEVYLQQRSLERIVKQLDSTVAQAAELDKKNSQASAAAPNIQTAGKAADPKSQPKGITKADFDAGLKRLQDNLEKEEKEVVAALKNELEAILQKTFANVTNPKDMNVHLKSIVARLNSTYPSGLLPINETVSSLPQNNTQQIDNRTKELLSQIEVLNQTTVEAILRSLSASLNQQKAELKELIQKSLKAKIALLEPELKSLFETEVKDIEKEGLNNIQELSNDVNKLITEISHEERAIIGSMRLNYFILWGILCIIPLCMLVRYRCYKRNV